MARSTKGVAGDQLPTVGEVDDRALRVHSAVIDIPYVPRTAKEREVSEHLDARRPVLLVGSSMVGKTRLATAVVRRLYRDRPIFIPDAPTSFATLDQADMHPR